jgi:hypothetical protein
MRADLGILEKAAVEEKTVEEREREMPRPDGNGPDGWRTGTPPPKGAKKKEEEELRKR